MTIASGACAYGANPLPPGGRVSETECGRSERAHVEVHPSTHQLHLCDRGWRLEKSFRVRLAKSGLGKSREGDKKLPIGEYPLADAVPSARFGQFLPIGYPTPEQRARGMTGSAVGVHGPAREARWLGGLVNTFDTTDGCVGLADDDEVRVVARFVHDRQAHLIVIGDARDGSTAQ